MATASMTIRSTTASSTTLSSRLDATGGSRRQLAAGLITAGSCVVTYAHFLGWPHWSVVTLAYVVLAGVLGYRRLSQVGQPRGWLPSVALAAFWLVSTGGVHNDLDDLNPGPTQLVIMMLAGAQMALVIRLAYEELWSWRPAPRRDGDTSDTSGTSGALSDRRWLLLYAGVPLAYWATYLVAYFPARMTFDSFWQWGMAHHVKQYNDWHPFLHTRLIELTSHVRDTPATFVVLQLVFAVSVIAYSLWSLQQFGAPRWLTVALALVYSAYPASAFFSVTLWKDFPFAYLVLLTTTVFAWIVWTRGDWLRRPAAVAALSACCFLTMHMRNNGLPSILLALILLAVFLRSVRLRLALITAGLVMAHLVWAGVVLPQFHVLKPPASQALAIPTQQIGATYARNGVFRPEVRTYFDSILPAQRWRDDYRSDTVNPIKHDPQYRDDLIASTFPTYVANWARLLADNPRTFVSAFARQTTSLWQYTPNSARAHVYVGTDLMLQDYSVGTRMLQDISDDYPQALTYPAAIDALYRTYNPNGCAPTDGSCRPGDRSDCFGELTCVPLTEFTARVSASQSSLVTSPASAGLKSLYDDLFQHLDTDWQGPFARGAIPLFLLMLSLAIALRRDRLRTLVFAPTLCVALSVAAGMPATDLRYAYGWIISVPFLLVLALLPGHPRFSQDAYARQP